MYNYVPLGEPLSTRQPPILASRFPRGIFSLLFSKIWFPFSSWANLERTCCSFCGGSSPSLVPCIVRDKAKESMNEFLTSENAHPRIKVSIWISSKDEGWKRLFRVDQRSQRPFPLRLIGDNCRASLRVTRYWPYVVIYLATYSYILSSEQISSIYRPQQLRFPLAGERTGYVSSSFGRSCENSRGKIHVSEGKLEIQ